MIGEVDFYGVLLPPLLVWLGLGFILSAALRLVLARAGLYRFVWDRPLFDFSLLIIATFCVAALVNGFLT
jgi:hypothetical protein